MERNIYILDEQTPQPQIGLNSFPEPTGHDTEPEWYLKNIYYIANLYNQPTQNVNVPYGSDLNEWFKDFDNAESGGFMTAPSDWMLYMMTYGVGKQPNLSYNHEATPVDGNNSRVKYTRGHTVQVFLDKLMGGGQEDLEELKMGADPLSPDAKGLVEEMAEEEILKLMISKLIEKELKDAQNPEQQEQKFKNLDEIKKWKAEGIKDHLADVYLAIAKDIWEKGYWIEDALKILKYGAVCGAASVELMVDNGYVKKLVHPPWNVVFDTNHDEDFGRTARVGGVFINMTLTEIYQAYPQIGSNPDIREEMIAIAQNRDMRNSLNSANSNFYWWGRLYATPTSTDYTCCVGRCYWIGTKIINGIPVECPYTGTLIGNKYLVDWAPCDNRVRDPNQPYIVQIPLRQWTFGLSMGLFNSMVERVHMLQDKVSFYEMKKDDVIAKAKGKIPAVLLDKLGMQNIVQFLEQIASYGIVGITHSGLADNLADREKLVETIDMTIGGDVRELIAAKQDVLNEMASFFGTGKVSLGEQTNYIGAKATEVNRDQSALGMNTFYKSWMYFVLMCLRYQINQKKNIYASGQLEQEALTVIGKKGLMLLKKTKSKYCEDFGIYLRHNDRVSESERNAMLEMAKAMVNQPNHGITLEDMYELMFTPTKSGIKDKYRAQAAEQDERAMRDLKAKLQNEKEIEAGKDAKEVKLATIDSQTQLSKTHMNNETKKYVADKKAGDTPPTLPVKPIQEQPLAQETPEPAAAPPGSNTE